jgi:hypothetical protein
VDAFLGDRFQSTEERFVRRLTKLNDIEHLYMGASEIRPV